LFLTLSQGCGAVSIDDRYGKPNYEKPTLEKKSNPFDFKPFTTVPGFINSPKESQETERIFWTHYDSSKSTTVTIVKDIGYRVQLLSTDNYDEANNLKLDLQSRLRTTAVYVVFESPYYKVKAGDLKENSHAYELTHKLKQLGYKNALVVQDSILTER
jgi:hypothetical protein